MFLFLKRRMGECAKSDVFETISYSLFACKITDVGINTQYLLIGKTFDVSNCSRQCCYGSCQNNKTDKGNVVSFPLPVLLFLD